MSKPFEIVAQGASGRAELRIYGDIGEDWFADESNDAKTIADKLSGVTGDLDVRINSFGGSVADGLAIFNALKRRDGAVYVHIDGVAYSIASMIAMAGSTVSIASNALMMIHAPHGGALGNAEEMRQMANILDKHAEAMLSAYLRDGGPDADTIRGWLTDGDDHYFTAAEALSLGLADVTAEASGIDIAASLRGTGYKTFQTAVQGRATTRNADMADEKTSGNVSGAPDSSDITTQHSATVRAADIQGRKAEAARVKTISAVFDDFYDADPLNPITAVHDACMADIACDELEARRKLQAALKSRSSDPIVARQQYGMEYQPSAPPNASRYLGGAMQVSADQADLRAAGLSKALQIKAGLILDRAEIDKERKGEFLAMSVTDIMAQELRAAGYQVGGMREDIARAYTRALPVLAAGPSHGTDSLPAVLGNIANLSAMQGWEASSETWQQWTQSGTLNNYQTATRANMAMLDKLQLMQENQEWEYGGMADVKQRITAFFHGLKYSLSLQALANDELGELSRAMQGWGESASATVGDYVFALLTASGTGGLGQVMDEDSKVLFHADHGNYIASGAGGVPTETSLNTARAAMVAQADQNSRKVAVRPQYIIHGPALWSTVRKVLGSEDLQEVSVDGATGATVLSGSTNTARDMNLTPIEEYRFTANQWLLAAARRTVEVAGVGGPVTPRAEQAMVSNTPGITYELSMPFGAAVLDHRGLRYNHGA